MKTSLSFNKIILSLFICAIFVINFPSSIYGEDSLEDFFISSQPSMYDYLEHCYQPTCTYVDSTQYMIYEMSFKNYYPVSDDNFIYLFEIASFQNEEDLSDLQPIRRAFKNDEIFFAFPYVEKHLFTRFVPAILINGQYVSIYHGQYISNPEALAKNTSPYPEIESKKGILLDANTIGDDKFYDLNCKRIVYNIPLSFIVGESDNDECPTIDFDYDGKTYHFNGYLCAGFDDLFSKMTAEGYYSTAIILNDWNKKNLELIHPLARRKTGLSMFYAMNTEEEEGVRLLEATALFLAKRYSSGQYGMVHDWVIANEVNQQRIWNYMSTGDLDYYTESFEKSFRTFYNAIKSTYSNANVYYSIDHDWNNNHGNNYDHFNGKDFVDTFNDYASTHGNYNWGLSIHPYPQPLPRVKFWTNKFEDKANAVVITPMNLSTLTDAMQDDRLLDTNGDVRQIAITELGFSSKAGEKLQAAAFAYCYYIIEDNKYINSFLLNRQTDDTAALKSGLALGIYNNDYSEKLLHDVFKNIDSPEGAAYIDEMLEIIGADSLEEALSWAR